MKKNAMPMHKRSFSQFLVWGACAILWACGGDDASNKLKPEGVEVDSVDKIDKIDMGSVEEDMQSPDLMLPDALSIPTSLETRLSLLSVRAGERVDVFCDVLDQYGEVIDYGEGKEAPVMRVLITQEDAMVREREQTYVARIAGEASVLCASNDLALVDATPAKVMITPGEPFSVITKTPTRTLVAGEDILASCDVSDVYGNTVDVVPALATSPMGDGVMVEQLRATMTRSGVYALSCDVPGAQNIESVEVEVRPGLPAQFAVAKSPDQALYGLGQVVTVETVVTDAYHNMIPNAAVSFRSKPIGRAFGPGRFRYQNEGRHVITARVDAPTHNDVELSQSVEIMVNGNGPSIKCVYPKDGEMLNAQVGKKIMVSGMLEDANGVSEVDVNGASEPIMVQPDGSFKLPYQVSYGINFIDITARDAQGEENSRTCAFLASNRWVRERTFLKDAIALKLTQKALDDFNNNDGFDSLSDIMLAVLNSNGLKDTLHTSLLEQNPLRNSCEQRVFGRCVYRLRLNYQDVVIKGANDVEIKLVPGGWRIMATLRNVEMKVRVSGTLSTTGWVKLNSVTVDLTSNLGLDALGNPSVSLRGINGVSVGSIDLDFRGVAGFVIDIVEGLFEGRLRNLVRDTVRDFVNTEFNALLDGVVSNLDVSSLGTKFHVSRLNGNGKIEVGFGVDFTSINTNTSRTLFGLGTKFTGPVARAGMTRGAPIPSGLVRRDPTTSKSAAAAIHVGVLNNVLHVLWRAGFLDTTLSGKALSAGLPARTSVKLSTRLPPVVVLTSNKKMQLHLGAMDLLLIYPGIFDEPLRMTIGAKASTVVSLQGNELKFGNILLESLYFSTPNVSLDETTRSVLEGFVRVLLQRVVNDSLNSALPALPIPRFDVPPEFGLYGLPFPSSLGINSPTLKNDTKHFSLDGNFGF